ncbi:hypothetical protein SADUNF_Sadunf08G0100900 [Salix dunnii]|uniref:Reticulon-like protein n=1 Tax=Salix dunnii TaxID=1413687 RepID=A0A835JY76_9ROSI|nr:hypothetical protein SADUNF_Sadunf08G0100900 [Salix dunnii]
MAASISILAVIISLNLVAFVLAIGAESRRSTAKVVADQYDERTYCVYDTDASTVYGLSAFGLLLISQMIVNGVTRCLCFGKGLVTGSCSTTSAIIFFILSWLSFLGAEACLLAGSARNAYHTKYRGFFHQHDLSCATLRRGVFAAGAALTLLSLIGSVLYYWAHSRADTGGWEKHQNEGVGMTSASYPQQQQTIADILLWKNKTLSGGILGGVTAIWLLLGLAEYSLVTVFAHILMLLMIALFTWSKIAGLIKTIPPTSNEIRLPESAFRFFFDQLNETILTFYKTSIRQKGLKTFFVTLAGLYILSFIGSILSTMTFAYLAFYGQNKMQLDEVLGKNYKEMNNLLKDFRSKLFDKIPRGKDD